MPPVQAMPERPQITAAVYVQIRQFDEWFHTHSAIKTMLSRNEDTGLLQHYGLWGYCAGCHHEYEPSVLKALLIALDCQRNGGEFSFATKTEKSKGDMAALVA